MIKADKNMPIAQVWRVLDPRKPAKIDEVTVNGSLSTLDEISSQLPNGVYTTFRTFEHNKLLPLELHFRRLEESAALLNKPILLNRTLLRDALREIVKLSQEQELRIRITLTLDNQPGTIYISTEPLITPKVKDYEKGVNTVTRRAERKNPKAKQTSFLRDAEIMRNEVLENINEIILINSKGQILEGLSSNFFAIKNGEIWTEDKQVLPGIVRSIVLEEATTAGFRIHLDPVYISEIERLEEAFLTSASRSLLPIQKIDGQSVGTVRPGHITKKLIVLYQQHIQKILEEL